ncbi:MAG: S41 family peptidase [Erysipelotrichaceae bacterium]|nr:S41 family peptidase [Erysipelotrichaceae bacterium]
MSEEKVVVKLIKKPLKSEREEIRQKKRHKFYVFLLCLCIFLAGTGVGFGATFLRKYTLYVSHSNNKFDEIKDYMKKVWLYSDEYEDLDTLLEDKAFYGMTNFADDRYTTYMSKEQLSGYVQNINKNYVGIGIQYYTINNNFIVEKIFKDSPAENAGMHVGDVVTKISGVDISDKTSDEIKELVLGEEGTVVEIVVQRGNQEITLNVVRGQVDSTVYAEGYEDYVLLEISSFGNNTANEIIKYLDEYLEKDKLIIDLRNNGGGYEKAAREVAGLFLGDDAILMNEVYNNGDKQVVKVISNRHYTNFKKVVILTNENTASAAEVFTIAMKEQLAGVSQVGITTYGKGIVLSTYTLTDGSALKMSVAYWTSPNGVFIDKEGIKPDVEVYLDELMYMSLYEIGDQTFKYDEVSSYVEVCQRALNFVGYPVDRTDGYFDKSTEKMVEKYRKDKGLSASNIIDKEFYDALLLEVDYLSLTDKSKDLQMLKAIEIIRED